MARRAYHLATVLVSRVRNGSRQMQQIQIGDPFPYSYRKLYCVKIEPDVSVGDDVVEYMHFSSGQSSKFPTVVCKTQCGTESPRPESISCRCGS
jgi:hypothetical protein